VVIGADDGARQSVIVSPCLVRVRFWQRLRPRALLQQKVIKEHNPHIAGDMGSIQLRLQELGFYQVTRPLAAVAHCYTYTRE
jgi:hypothetical protein